MTRIKVGEITKAVGLKGEVKVYPTSDYPEHLTRLETVYLGNEASESPVQKSRYHNGAWTLLLEGIDSREKAEKLRGVSLFISETQLRPLPKGEYYWYQLEGLSVYTEAGQLLGTLRSILRTGANDVYVVANQEGEILIPALKRVIRVVDLMNRKMVIWPMPGLLDDDNATN